jgi:MFS family permease
MPQPRTEVNETHSPELGDNVETSAALRRLKTEADIEKDKYPQSRQPSAASRVISRTPTAVAPPKFSLLRETLFVGIITSAQLLTQAGLAQAVAPLHTIGASLGATNPGQLSWLAAGYSLTVGTFILVAGRWGDLYGHKLIFIIGYFWFAVWSLIAGLSVYSHSLIFFAFCRAMQGIGPALVLPNGIAILSRTYPPGPKQSMVLSIFGASAPGGFILGAVFSGVFAQLLWWPWAYWVMGIICAITGVLSLTIIPVMPVIGDKPKMAELDILGSMLGVIGLVLFNFAWNQGPSVGWDRPYVYVILIVSLGILAAFFFVESKISKYPLLPASAFSKDTSLVFACIAAGWASFGIWVYYFW